MKADHYQTKPPFAPGVIDTGTNENGYSALRTWIGRVLGNFICTVLMLAVLAIFFTIIGFVGGIVVGSGERLCYAEPLEWQQRLCLNRARPAKAVKP